MSLQAQLQQIQQILARQDFEAAEQLALSLHDEHPDNGLVLKACVQAFVRGGKLERAVEFAEQLLRKEPDNLGYVSNLSRWTLALGQTDKAHGYYRDLLKRQPDHPQALYQLGVLYRETQDPTESVAHLERALAAGYRPKTDCYLQLALALGDIRQEASAVEYLERVLEIDPDHQLALFNLATLKQAAGQKEASERLFTQILERDPTFTEALVRLIYGRKMTPDDRHWLRRAERRARSTLTQSLEREGLSFALGKAYDDLKEFDTAFAHMRLANDLQRKRIGPYDAAEMRQFVDQSLAHLTQDWLGQPIADADFKPIFILGHFRSGSTLVEQMLAGHSATFSLGEVDFFLRHWHTQRQNYFNTFESTGREQLTKLASQYRSLIGHMGCSHQRGIDKRPENLMFIGLIRKLFPGARFIHTRRHFLDNALSVYFQQLNDLSRFGTSLLDFADYDEQCLRLLNHCRSLFGEVIHSVDYEAMVTEPEATARALLKFLELGWEPACLDFQRRDNFVRTASMSQVREGIHTRSVGRGKQYLSFFSEAERSACLSRR